MSDGSQAFSECEQFPGRLRDLCDGRGRDGRPHPRREHSDNFRKANGLPPIPANLVPGGPRQTAESQKPLTTIQRAASVTKAAKDYIASGGNLLTEEQIAIRFAVCQTCDQLENNVCRLCGCCTSRAKNFANKLAHPLQICPHKPPKWGQMEAASE